MKNADLKLTGDKLTITVDLAKDFGPSNWQNHHHRHQLRQ